MFDPARAIEDFARGVQEMPTRPKTIEVVSNVQSPSAEAEIDFIRSAWDRLGITLVPKFIPDWSEFERYVQSDSMQVYRYAWYADMPDPGSFLHGLFGVNAEANFMRFGSDEVNGMLQSAGTVFDPLERARLYQEIQTAIFEAFPLLPLFHLSIDIVHRPSVRGY